MRAARGSVVAPEEAAGVAEAAPAPGGGKGGQEESQNPNQDVTPSPDNSFRLAMAERCIRQCGRSSDAPPSHPPFLPLTRPLLQVVNGSRVHQAVPQSEGVALTYRRAARQVAGG